MPQVRTAEAPGDHRSGSALSEDVVLVLPNAVAVLDGATSLRPRARSGGWYATRLAEQLAERLPDPALDLAELLAESIAAVAREHGLRPGESPSSTAALLRWSESEVDALVLADSPVVLFTAGGERPVLDTHLAQLRGSRGGFRDRLRSGAGFDAGHREALGTAMSRTARWRNVEGGFWVAEAVPEAAFHATRTRTPRREVRSALVASDGVSCGVQDYGIYESWSAMLSEAQRCGPRAVLDRVRAAEESDPDGARWPRPKRHDDQALALVDFDA